MGLSAPLAQGVACACQRSELIGQLLWVEPTIAPRHLAVVDRFVLDAMVVKRRQQPGLNAGKQVAAIDEIVVAQRQDVGLVSAVRRGARRACLVVFPLDFQEKMTEDFPKDPFQMDVGIVCL